MERTLSMRTLIAVVLVVACGGPHPPPVKPAPLPDAPVVQEAAKPAGPAPLDEKTVTAKSHAFFDLLDHHDVAFADSVTANFVMFQNTRFLDRDTLKLFIAKRKERGTPVRTRTFNDEQAWIGPSSALWIGEVVEHWPAAGDQKAQEVEGWLTLVWVPDGSTWKIAHYQWQKGGIDAERDIWNDRYRAGTGFSHKPNQLLVDTVKGKKPGSALDLAMGQGRNAVFLASQRWKVTGVDISDEGIRIANENAAKQSLKLETIQANLDTWDAGKDKWDLVTMIYAGADPQQVERIKPAMKKHGLFVMEFFTSEAMIAKAGVAGWKPGELAALFPKDQFKILRDDLVEETADWGLTPQKLERFVAEKL